MDTTTYLVGGLEHFFFIYIYIFGNIIPTDEVIFFRGVAKNHQPVYIMDIWRINGDQWGIYLAWRWSPLINIYLP